MSLDNTIIAIPFNKPYMTAEEMAYMTEAHANGVLAGDGLFAEKCHAWLEERIGCKRAFLTHSGTAALEMASLLVGIGAGDEVIMPSFTFPSVANAVVLRGGTPVFIDIRSDTLNLNENLIEAAVTRCTKALCPVHYAGVGCEMNRMMTIAQNHGLRVIEDAAHGIMARYRGRPLGSMGRFGALSFHETKNIICGEGGALLVNDLKDTDRVEILREKGTDRSRFFRGEITRYTWQDVGSSFLLGELNAAFLLAQMQAAEDITIKRLAVWKNYHDLLEELECQGLLRRPVVPEECSHNGHTYYVLLPDRKTRDRAINELQGRGIQCVFHYIPLHSSPAGIKYGRACGRLSVTDDVSGRIMRLPVWVELTFKHVEQVVAALEDVLRR